MPQMSPLYWSLLFTLLASLLILLFCTLPVYDTKKSVNMSIFKKEKKMQW